jgi:hypothetical protein
MALACWNSIEDWQAFAAENDSVPPDPEAFQAMGAVSEHIATEILEEVADLLDCGSWRRSGAKHLNSMQVNEDESLAAARRLAYMLHIRFAGTLCPCSKDRAGVETHERTYW